MTFNNRAADARLGRIEKALQTAENRLDAEVHAGNEGGNSSVSDELHGKINTLVDEAAHLHPVSDVGLASKARIVVKNYHLPSVGESVLYSLAEDLQIKANHRG